jgi:hypothetical protein
MSEIKMSEQYLEKLEYHLTQLGHCKYSLRDAYSQCDKAHKFAFELAKLDVIYVDIRNQIIDILSILNSGERVEEPNGDERIKEWKEIETIVSEIKKKMMVFYYYNLFYLILYKNQQQLCHLFLQPRQSQHNPL